MSGRRVNLPDWTEPTPSPKPNGRSVVLDSKQVCKRLGISRRTLTRRLYERGWAEGHWFFRLGRRWYIRESHLEELIGLMETGQIKM